MSLIQGETMTTINLPKSIVYGAVCLAFILMFVRSLQVSVENWRRGYSILERPEAFDVAPI
jgi:TRAP-type C4-dicarboxylate transport system permease small subunit